MSQAEVSLKAGGFGRTMRTDAWWVQPAIVFLVLSAFVVYATWAALQGKDYAWGPYLSPFYSPLLFGEGRHAWVHAPRPGWWPSRLPFSAAMLILWVPALFRVTCYYYRGSYYKAFWADPPACTVGEPRACYRGERSFPLILQNVHRYFLYIALIFNVVLTIDAVLAFKNHSGQWGHMGLGTLVLIVNAALLWLYSLSCHACRHVTGGRLKHFSRHPVRYKAWTIVSKLNARHMQYAWISLGFVLFTDLYIRLVASGAIADPRFF
jgi:hypothetical protein